MKFYKLARRFSYVSTFLCLTSCGVEQTSQNIADTEFVDNHEFTNSELADNKLDANGNPSVSTQHEPFVAQVPEPDPSWPGVPIHDFESTGEFANAPASTGLEIGQALPAADDGFEPFSFVNYETPHVHPLDLHAATSRLLAVNTADNSLMVFDVASGTPVLERTIPVGIDPVSVRFRTASEAWVVNHISDSISIVDLNQGRVTRSLPTSDEPTDVVFAGSPVKAFVSASQVNRLDVFRLSNLNAAPQSVAIHGEDPRMLAVSADGEQVFAAIFESGNGTTLVAGGKRIPTKVLDAVVRREGPYRGRAVPPNDGNDYSPPINPALPDPVAASMIVRKDDQGRWRDDNDGDWTRLISGDLSSLSNRVRGWDLPDNDIAVIDANSLTVTYQKRLMNLVMALDVNPVSGEILAVGTEAINEVRWEPNLNGVFVRATQAKFQPGGSASISDLNPHLDYIDRTIPPSQRSLAIGDPRGVRWTADGSNVLITGMGSNNVVVLDQSGNRSALVEVGEGPTGVVIDNVGARAFVLNKFSASISVIDTNNWTEVEQVPFFDPTPEVVKAGRPILYDTHKTSGLGQAACASCHVDARTDRLVWDLGDPTGSMTRRGGFSFHPMKGPLKTQTFQDIIGVPAMHHIGDKDDIFGFADAFRKLQGTAAAMDTNSMAQLEAMLDTVHFPPNPNRNIDNSLSTRVIVPGPKGTTYAEGDAALGFQQFMTGQGTSSHCAACHGNARTRSDIVKGANNGFIRSQPLIAESLRGFYDRHGMFRTSVDGSTSGFGYLPDGAQGSELINTARNFPLQSQSGFHVHAFMLSLEGPLNGLPGLARDSHAGAGQQVTISENTITNDYTRLDELISIANSGNIGLIVRGHLNGVERGLYYIGQDRFQSDRLSQVYSYDQILAAIRNNDTVTFTLVPLGTEYRLGVDNDLDGVLNRDEIDVNANPRLTEQNNWVACAGDGGNCDFNGTAAVRFGANGNFLYGVYSGGVACNVGVFGDNRSGDTMQCWVSEFTVEAVQPVMACTPINFARSPILSYSSQDEGNHDVMGNGKTLRVFNNGWKAIRLPIDSANAVIEFEFKSTTPGEEHTIGLEQDLQFNNNLRFKLFGNQNTSAWAFQDFNNYRVSDGYKRYVIRVGDFLSGSYAYITFAADHDAAPSNGDSLFRNVLVYDDPEGDGCNAPPPIVITPPEVQQANNERSNPVQSQMTIDGIHAEWTSLTSYGVDSAESEISEGEIDLLETWLANDAENLYIAYRQQHATPLVWGHSLHIDVDQNPNTGFRGFSGEFPIGVDYILEGAHLHRYSGNGTNWSFEEQQYLPHAVVGNTIEITLPMTELGSPQSFDHFFIGKNSALNGTVDDYYPDTVTDDNSTTRYFTYTTAAANNNLLPPVTIVPVPEQVNSQPPTSPQQQQSIALVSNGSASITLDADLTDWAAYTPFNEDPRDISVADNSIDWLQASIAHDSEDLFFAFTMGNSTELTWGHSIFIDTDQQRASGFVGFDNNYPVGADYLLEGEQLFRYTGDGSNWAWAPVVFNESNQSGTVIEMKTSRASIGNPEVIDLFFMGKSIALQGNETDYYPDVNVDSGVPTDFFSYQLTN